VAVTSRYTLHEIQASYAVRSARRVALAVHQTSRERRDSQELV